MNIMFRRVTKATVVAILVLTGLIAGSASAGPGLRSRVFASGANIFHTTPKGREAISLPDDLTYFKGHVFVAYQNGVGAQGEPSTTGNKDSTIVEFGPSGHAVHQWDVVGKTDGLTADPLNGRLIATVNEDAKSSVYLIDPVAGGAAIHYRYSRPLPSKGGTDAIAIYHGMVVVTASAPGTTGTPAPSAKYPASRSPTPTRWKACRPTPTGSPGPSCSPARATSNRSSPAISGPRTRPFRS